MGEMADDMIEGASCSWCGVYFKKEHGYPVVCFSCGKGKSDKQLLADGVQRATEKEL